MFTNEESQFVIQALDALVRQTGLKHANLAITITRKIQVMVQAQSAVAKTASAPAPVPTLVPDAKEPTPAEEDIE